jgi:hypothetical protein
MTIILDSVLVRCDATCQACDHQCTAITQAVLKNGEIRVTMPPQWTQDGDQMIGPQCTEERALQKAMEADLPDPAEDPPALKETREQRLETMKETVRADLEEREAEFPELREFMRTLTVSDGDMPDFMGHVGKDKAGARVEVRVRGDYVEILWPGEQTMNLTLKHEELVLVDPPPFIDPDVLTWVQSCLKTMSIAEVSDRSEPVAH